MADLTTLARPYAKAAFEHALEAKQLAEWSDMLALAALVVSDELMQQLLTSPHFTIEDQKDAMLKVCQDKLDSHGTNFIKLLAKNNRLLALPEIEVLFNYLRSEFEKTIEAQITSAIELNEQQITQLKEKLAARLGRQVDVSVDIDSDLLGGLIIKAEDLVIDGSVRGKLAKLSDTLNV